MVLTTGNKSENAVGYATLYAATCLAVNSVFKKDVFKRWFQTFVVPQYLGIRGFLNGVHYAVHRSAEWLRDQKMKILCKLYILDDILRMYIEEDQVQKPFLLLKKFDR